MAKKYECYQYELFSSRNDFVCEEDESEAIAKCIALLDRYHALSRQKQKIEKSLYYGQPLPKHFHEITSEMSKVFSDVKPLGVERIRKLAPDLNYEQADFAAAQAVLMAYYYKGEYILGKQLETEIKLIRKSVLS